MFKKCHFANIFIAVLVDYSINAHFILVGIELLRAERKTRSEVFFLNKGQIWAWAVGRGDAFQKFISTKLYVQFTRGPFRVVSLFNKNCLWLDLAHLGRHPGS